MYSIQRLYSVYYGKWQMYTFALTFGIFFLGGQDLHLRETLLEQIEWCKQRKMKKQKETLLLVLQV